MEEDQTTQEKEGDTILPTVDTLVTGYWIAGAIQWENKWKEST